MAPVVTLQEQMGATSIVDELRHRQMVVQDLVDLPARREEVARRIREYYQSAQIAVDEALIEAGVRKYFDRRLTFEVPSIGRIQGILANLYITRDRWLGKLFLTVGIVVAVAVVAWGVDGYRTASHVSETQSMADQQRAARWSLVQQVSDLSARLVKLDSEENIGSVPAAGRLISAARSNLAALAPMLAGSLPDKVSVGTLAKDRPAIEAIVDRTQEARTKVQMVKDQLVLAEQILIAQSGLNQLTRGTDYKLAVAEYAQLGVTANEAFAALDVADQRPIAATEGAVSAVRDKLRAIGQLKPLLAELLGLESGFKAMGLPPGDEAKVKAMAKTVRDALQAMDVTTAVDSVASMKRAQSFAQTPLTVNVVDRSGVKSGVERNYKKSGGKTWYLVVEATDPQGAAVAVPVTSSETGEKAFAKLFAVRVSEEEYQRVKADKLKDGHVDVKAMGSKPANALSLQFNSRALPAGDVILKW